MLSVTVLSSWSTFAVLLASAPLISSARVYSEGITPPHPSVVNENSAVVLRPAPANSFVNLAQAELDVVDTLAREGNFDTFLELFQELGMAEDLRGYGRFTVFAPTDEAFAALDPDLLAVLTGDRELLAQVLSYHVIASGTPIYATNVTQPTSFRTLERSEVELRSRRSRMYVEGIQAIESDIEATNGVIHAIDEVLIPQSVLDQL